MEGRSLSRWTNKVTLEGGKLTIEITRIMVLEDLLINLLALFKEADYSDIEIMHFLISLDC